MSHFVLFKLKFIILAWKVVFCLAEIACFWQFELPNCQNSNADHIPQATRHTWDFAFMCRSALQDRRDKTHYKCHILTLVNELQQFLKMTRRFGSVFFLMTDRHMHVGQSFIAVDVLTFWQHQVRAASRSGKFVLLIFMHLFLHYFRFGILKLLLLFRPLKSYKCFWAQSYDCLLFWTLFATLPFCLKCHYEDNGSVGMSF